MYNAGASLMVLGAPRATSRLGPRLLNAVPKTGPGGRPRGPRVWIKTKSPHRRPNTRSTRKRYLVAWTGYGPEFDSWVDDEQIEGSPRLLAG